MCAIYSHYHKCPTFYIAYQKQDYANKQFFYLKDFLFANYFIDRYIQYILFCCQIISIRVIIVHIQWYFRAVNYGVTKI